MKRGAKSGNRSAGGKSKAARRGSKYQQDEVDEQEQINDLHAHEEQRQDDDNDDAPEEIPVDKASFIPLVSSKKRKRGESAKAPAGNAAAGPETGKTKESTPAKKPKLDGQFFERIPGHYFGSKKTEKFRVVDLSSNANVKSSAHKHAQALKNGMFSRHRRVTGTQYLGLLQKSNMVGKG